MKTIELRKKLIGMGVCLTSLSLILVTAAYISQLPTQAQETSSSINQGNTATLFNDSSWKIVTFKQGASELKQTKTNQHILIFQDDHITSRACNTMNWKYVLLNNKINAQELTKSKKACDNSLGLQEQVLAEALKKGVNIGTHGVHLTLKNKDGLFIELEPIKHQNN